jgi:hypothetical protein
MLLKAKCSHSKFLFEYIFKYEDISEWITLYILQA